MGQIAQLAKSRYGPPVLLGAIWVVMLIAVNPIGDFPLNDDWCWGHSVKTLYETHVFAMHQYTGASVVAQVLWGFLWCLPFGFSFTALRMSTAVLGLAVVIATYGLGREAGASKGLAFVCALAIATNPLIFESSITFMTDVPFLAFLLLSVWCFVHTARSGSWATTALAIVLTLAAAFTRQIGMIVPVLFAIGCLLSRMLTVRHLAVAAVSGLLAREGLRMFEDWLRATGQLSPNYGSQMRMLLPRLLHPFSTTQSVLSISDGLYMLLTYVGFFLVPALIAILPRRWHAPKLFLLAGAAAAGWFGWIATQEMSRPGWTMPFNPYYNLVNIGLGPTTLPDVYVRHAGNLPGLAMQHWTTITRVGVAAGCLIVMLCITTGLELLGRRTGATGKPGKLVAAMALSFIAAYGAVLVLMPHDRYFVPMFPMLLIVGMWNAEAGVGRWGSRLLFTLALIGIVLQGTFSVAATHDYLAWNRARWTALHELMEVDGVTPAQIDGGYEFNGMYRFGSPVKPGKSPWWVEDDLYMITFGPLPGYRTLRTYPYDRWLVPGDASISVLVREQP